MKLNISFINFFKNLVINNKNIGKFYDKKYTNTKYELDDIINGIFYILKTGISWRDSLYFINYNTLYYHYSRFVKYDIFKKIFLKLRKQNLLSNKSNIHLIDSTFILNKFGHNKIKRNKYFKNKNCNKISMITDINGLPLSILINTGNVHDLSFVEKHMKDMYIFTKNKKNNDNNNNNNNNNYLLLADKTYESSKHREYINKFNYQFMIPKKKNMNRDYHFDKNIYKSRIIIENTFQKLKVFRRIMIRYDSLFKNYFSFVYFGCSLLIYNYLFD